MMWPELQKYNRETWDPHNEQYSNVNKQTESNTVHIAIENNHNTLLNSLFLDNDNAQG